MKRFGILAAAMLLAAACEKAPEAPAAPVAEAPAATPAAAPADTASQDPAFGDMIQKFDPRVNHFVWVLPPGVHGEEPWQIDVTIKHKGEVKRTSKIPLKAEIVKPGTYPEFPPGSEAIRLSDAGAWAGEMDEVGRYVQDLIAKYGRGEGELVMQSLLNVKLDDAGQKTYCVEKKTADISLFFEEPPAKLTRINLQMMRTFLQAEVVEDCPK